MSDDDRVRWEAPDHLSHEMHQLRREVMSAVHSRDEHLDNLGERVFELRNELDQLIDIVGVMANYIVHCGQGIIEHLDARVGKYPRSQAVRDIHSGAQSGPAGSFKKDGRATMEGA